MPNLFGLILLLFFTLSEGSAAEPTAKSILEVLRQTPATASGLIAIEQNMELYKDQVGPLKISLKLNANEPIGFNFSEHHLTILPDKAITLSLFGVPVKFDYIQYDDTSGKFTVKCSPPFEGLRKVPGISKLISLRDEAINAEIEKVLNEKYKPKVVRAFKELSKFRTSQTMNDVDKVAQTIADIFSDGKRAPTLPVIKGNINLNFQPEKAQRFMFGDWKADIQANDNVMAGISFVKKNGKTDIKGVEFASAKGIRFSGKTKVPELVSINVSELKFSENGPYLVYDLGAEEVIAGFQLIISVLKTNSISDCTPIQLKQIRQQIDKELKGQLSNLIKIHYKALLSAGATPELLAALQ